MRFARSAGLAPEIFTLLGRAKPPIDTLDGPGMYYAHQYTAYGLKPGYTRGNFERINTLARIEGQKTVAVELTQQLGWELPEWVIVPGGNLGNVYALYKGFKLMMDLGVTDAMPRLVCAQAAQANPLYRAYKAGWDTYAAITAGPTLASAIRIGDPVSIRRAIKALDATDGIVEEASEVELADAMARADRAGAYVCPQSGIALAVLEKLVSNQTIRPGARVAVISTAHGLKFTNTKIAYHERSLPGIVSLRANQPKIVPSDPADVVETLTRLLRL